MFGFLRDQIRVLTGLSKSVKRLVTLDLTLSIIFEMVKIVPPLIFKEIIDNLIAYQPGQAVTFSFLIILVAGYFGSLAAMTIIEYFGLSLTIPMRWKANTDILDHSLRKLFELDLAYHERTNTGATIGKLLKGSHHLIEILFNIGENLFPIIIQALVTFVMLAISSVEICITYIIIMPLFLLLLRYDAMKTQPLREAIHKKQEEYSSIITESIGNIRTVKDFGNEEQERAKAGKLMRENDAIVEKRNRIGLRNMLIEDGLINFARLITLALAVWLMTEGKITAGTLVFVVTLTEKAYINLRRLGRVYFRMQDAEPAIQRFQRLFDEKITLVDKADAPHKIREGRVEFKEVTFAYPHTTAPALKSASFMIRPKSVVALVGRSGGGKTTVARLMLRHFDVTSGAIMIDYRDVNEYAFGKLRQGVAVVSQDVQLFDETIANNIAYGVPGAARKKVVAAARLAYADDFIRELPNGYDTVVGEHGVRLSGGQKQRIAIARAILRKPKILIFDEATAALDAESERYVHQAIFRLRGKLTLIIIAHRFATIEHAEQIILLDKGEVREIGTHAELLRRHGIFHKLRKLQKLGDIKS